MLALFLKELAHGDSWITNTPAVPATQNTCGPSINLDVRKDFRAFSRSGSFLKSGLQREVREEEDAQSWTNRSRLRTVVTSHRFDVVVTVFVLLNAMMVGAQTDQMARNLSFMEPLVYKILEMIFWVIFLLEIVLRLYTHGAAFFYKAGWQWNVVDLIIALVQSVDITLGILMGLMDVASVGGRGNLGFIRVLRILRLLRIVRVFRTMRTITELQSLVVSIVGTFRTLWWTLVLLFLVIFIIAVPITQIVSYHLIDESDSASRDDLKRFYGDLGTTILVLFQAITNGVNWSDMLTPLMTSISPWLALPVVLYIGFGVFALTNVVTGVFVESALEMTKWERERFLLHTVKNLFQITDEDNSGDISWEEFKSKLGEPAMRLYFKTINVDIGEAEALFHLIDINDSGSIDPEEFVNACIRLQGPAKAIDLATLMQEFKRSEQLAAKRHLYMGMAKARTRTSSSLHLGASEGKGKEAEHRSQPMQPTVLQVLAEERHTVL